MVSVQAKSRGVYKASHRIVRVDRFVKRSLRVAWGAESRESPAIDSPLNQRNRSERSRASPNVQLTRHWQRQTTNSKDQHGSNPYIGLSRLREFAGKVPTGHVVTLEVAIRNCETWGGKSLPEKKHPAAGVEVRGACSRKVNIIQTRPTLAQRQAWT